MKNTTKAILACAVVLTGVSVFAGPHDGGHHGCPPSSGVRLAADIVGLVGESLNILRGPVVYAAPAPQIVQTVPAAAPVVYTTPAAAQTTVIYTTPETRIYYSNPVYYRPAPPPPPPRFHPRPGPRHGFRHR